MLIAFLNFNSVDFLVEELLMMSFDWSCDLTLE